MKTRYLIALTAAFSISSAAFAADGESLFRQHKCNSCHAIDKKVLGPSVKDVAAKYQGDAKAQATLEAKVRSGGKGVFGTMPMPATKATVSDADIKTIVEWMLASK
ncbi:MAG TPA: c-type cytochrome [Gallionella sp.]